MKAAELTELAIQWLSATFPEAIIVRELSVADWGGASLDLGAITRDRIVGVEIKGDGDGPTRLDRQGISYGMVAREMWLLCAPSVQDKCFARRPPGWGRLEIHEGCVRPYNRATKMGEPIKRPDGGTTYPTVRDDSRYEPDRPEDQRHQTPWTMCGALWRDELYEIARLNRVVCGGRAARVQPLTEAICASLPVTAIHDEMIRALRARDWHRAKRNKVIDTRTSPLEDNTSAPMLDLGA